jgi:hypothetical protein
VDGIKRIQKKRGGSGTGEGCGELLCANPRLSNTRDDHPPLEVIDQPYKAAEILSELLSLVKQRISFCSNDTLCEGHYSIRRDFLLIHWRLSFFQKRLEA